jgi:Kef-type K+ transport system membrane component KefB
MMDLFEIAKNMAWPLTLLVAWLMGEFGFRWLKLPRMSAYAIVGFAVGAGQFGLLPSTPTNDILLLANIALGLILFEAGHRINMRWLIANPWMGISSVVESVLTFFVVFYLSTWFQLSTASSLLIASLSMATSPATIVRVVNEHRSSGQMTERLLHLSVLNCVLAVLTFKVIVGTEIFRASGNLGHAIYSSLVVIFASAILGAVMGWIMPIILRKIQSTNHDTTLAFAIAVIFLVALTHSLKQSPIVATIAFGLISRHRRIVLNSSQRGFGALGEVMSLFLFVFVATTFSLEQVLIGFGLGMILIFARCVTKIIGIGIFSHISGISWRKGWLTGMAMTPISAFVIVLLEQTRYLGVDLMSQLAPLAAMALTLEIIGPVVIYLALRLANEIPREEE